jgi:membrane protein involved in D-alanine export
MMIPYASFTFFAILLAALLPAVVMGLWGKRPYRFLLFLSLAFAAIIYGNHWTELLSLFGYVLYQWIVFQGFLRVRERIWGYRLALFLSLLPLLLVKIEPLVHRTSLIGFLGISYVTFKSVQMIIEARDRLIQQVGWFDFLQFLLFFPTLSSGPIDRYRRFVKDVGEPLTPAAYRDLLALGIHRLFQGFLYKFIFAFLIEKHWLPLKFLREKPFAPLLAEWHHQYLAGVVSFPAFQKFLSHLLYMYGYSLYLFFDFAGYSAFAIGVSYILGIRTPENFNRPFLSRNIKDFWNRWHMSLSFWFRDYVFMRLVMALTRKKVIQSKALISYIGYLALFGLMGVWHGFKWHYIVYGLYHAALFIGYDLFDRVNKRFRVWGKNAFFHALSVIFTFHAVCFGFYIFSGHLF